MSVKGTTTLSRGAQTITTGGTAQTVFPASGRNLLLIQNNHATEALFVGIGFTPTVGCGIWLMGGGGVDSTFIMTGNDISNAAISAISATTGHPFIVIQE